jgi:homoserine dehydrogenase
MSVKRLAIAGLGTVGCGLINMIQAQRPEGIEIVAVSARDRNAQREADISAYEWCDDPLEFVSRDDIDCVVEMIGSSEGVARTLVTNSIKAGKPVITANKALIADHGAELAHIVDEHDVFFGYEAAVAGGIPIIKSLREAFVGNDIKSISGILNGTSNFILSTMAHTGRDFADVLQEAQDLGYAEADPSFDIEGIDAAHKLAIMAGIAFKQLIDFKAVKVRGITEISTQDVQYARQTGHRVKL